MSKSKQELKLFTTLSSPQPSAPHKTDTQSSEQQQGTSKWGLFFAATHSLSLPIERLLLKTLNADLGVPGCIIDPYALAFRYSLLSSWRYKLAVGILASNYKKIVESSVVGVPGMLTYLDARTRWIDGHIKSAVQSQDGFHQVVILGGGFDTRSLRLGALFPSLQFFEVDSAQILNRKKTLISELPQELATKDTKPQITFVPMDWTNPSALIPALTAAGFQPTLKTILVMEGLLPHLDSLQSNTVLADAAALCAPGSKLLFDFLHLDAFDGSNRLYTGYSTLALALANKGAPFRSGHAVGFSDWSDQNTMAAAGGGDGITNNALESSSEEQNWCSVGHCLAPLRTSQGRGNGASNNSNPAAVPLSIALPQFYSLVSAVKTVPRISLKDAAPPLHLASLNTNAGVRRTQSSLGSISAPITSCFYRGLISMIWGHDTDDEAEHPAHRPPPPPPSRETVAGEWPLESHLPVSFPSTSEATGGGASLNRYQSSDWSLIASRGGEQQQHPAPASTNAAAGASSLEHAISIPEYQKYDEKGEVINKVKDVGGIGGSDSGGGGVGWWTSWIT
ncbi:hypothetical protein Ndes2437B_g03478 [Nannochloris sp. 'desiccata']